MALLDPLVDVYLEVLEAIAAAGATWVQIDEPTLASDRSSPELAALTHAYRRLGEFATRPNIMVATYFGSVGDAMGPLADLPVEGIGLDFCAGPANLRLLRSVGGLGARSLFAGVVDGRNVWANDLDATLNLMDELSETAADLVVSTSCSLAHVPATIDAEDGLDPGVRSWLAFAQEKLTELAALGRGFNHGRDAIDQVLEANRDVMDTRRQSPLRRDPAVRARIAQLAPDGGRRPGTLEGRRNLQARTLGLPPIPTTTIGSFPQTSELRAARASWRAGRLDDDAYQSRLRAHVGRVIALQEDIGLDLLVHGEPERDDMVRHFAERLVGFALPESGWVQSYGSRCVRPPILIGDIWRPQAMTVAWTTYAASLTDRPVKAMLTGPVTMLRWSFVRDDQPPADTATQLALAIADEVTDLEAAGVRVIQIDEPGLREGLPLQAAQRNAYLAWATRAFQLAVAPAVEATQIHTHMCYADFRGVVDALGELDVDVISLEAARSGMAAITVLTQSCYAGGVGPGIYDVHSPLVPSIDELAALLRDAVGALGAGRVWANPDCGLKTRSYDEVVPALRHLVAAARRVREEQKPPHIAKAQLAPNTEPTARSSRGE
jgi:5-methyltetrahydropteroyltriglutamate--homocysteine methyltransferase